MAFSQAGAPHKLDLLNQDTQEVVRSNGQIQLLDRQCGLAFISTTLSCMILLHGSGCRAIFAFSLLSGDGTHEPVRNKGQFQALDLAI